MSDKLFDLDGLNLQPIEEPLFSNKPIDNKKEELKDNNKIDTIKISSNDSILSEMKANYRLLDMESVGIGGYFEGIVYISSFFKTPNSYQKDRYDVSMNFIDSLGRRYRAKAYNRKGIDDLLVEGPAVIKGYSYQIENSIFYRVEEIIKYTEPISKKHFIRELEHINDIANLFNNSIHQIKQNNIKLFIMEYLSKFGFEIVLREEPYKETIGTELGACLKFFVDASNIASNVESINQDVFKLGIFTYLIALKSKEKAIGSHLPLEILISLSKTIANEDIVQNVLLMSNLNSEKYTIESITFKNIVKLLEDEMNLKQRLSTINKSKNSGNLYNL